MLPAVFQAKVCILWDSELRLAATALKRARDLCDATPVESRTDDQEREIHEAIVEAVNLAAAALNGAENGEAAIVISAVPPLETSAWRRRPSSGKQGVFKSVVVTDDGNRETAGESEAAK